jgi:hypothetical protein
LRSNVRAAISWTVSGWHCEVSADQSAAPAHFG